MQRSSSSYPVIRQMWPQAVVHNISLISALVWAINGHYGRSSSLPLTLAQFSRRQVNRYYHNDLIDATLTLASNQGNIKFLLDNLNDLDVATDIDTSLSGIEGLETAIWFIDSLQSYLRLERNLLEASSSYKRNGFYVMVYTGGEKRPVATIQEIFNRLFYIYVLNVSVFLLSEYGNVELYTYFPYRPERCRSTLPVHYGTHPLPEGYSLFPSKLNNLYGCELIAVTFEHRPFVIIESNNRLRGIEGLIFDTLAEHLNFTYKIIVEEHKNRGVILPNGTTTGALKMILDGTANITFCGYMYTRERAFVMLPTISYTSFPIVLSIPGGGPMSPLERLAKPFRYIIWLCLVVTLLLAFSVTALIQLCTLPGLRHLVFDRRNRLPCMAIWNTLLGGLTMYPPSGTFARCLLTMWMLQVLVLRAAYTGQLYFLLQDGDVRTPLSTLGEVVDKRYIFYSLPSLAPIFYPLMPKNRIKVILNAEQPLIRLRDEEDPRIAVALFLQSAKEFDQRSGPNKPQLQLLPEPLMIGSLTMYMRPHSYLKRRIDRILLGMMSAGIVRRFRRIHLEKIEHLSKTQQLDPVPLSVWLLSGVFGCHLTMLLLSIGVFLMEMAAERWPRLRKIMNAANRYIA